MLLCGECGHVPECPRCSTALTYHSANGRLMCHYCGHSRPLSDMCPICGGVMKHVGTGTQRVEEELKSLFPDAGVLRMDADTVAGNHEKLLARFEQEKIPILLGTQMVAKGLDFENVTLVGVISADSGLYVPDFRAGERTFSLITQVVGRAGRGAKAGAGVIQTYTPDNDVITFAARQDYDSFYAQELELRRATGMPPFRELFVLTASGRNEEGVLRACQRLRQAIDSYLEANRCRRCRPTDKSLFRISLHAALAGLFTPCGVTAPAGASRRNRRRRLLEPIQDLPARRLNGYFSALLR